ncbi:hypothetical protein D9613_012856 [Agrocybe pediades]|uniref:J domain-containing protein n=1 Tax=Agrocybe pediades TaxID=84607 RepID=A0A8H4QXC5_9AGAR|nr:hypothetical protein D9613_012856 [Agrocybe pediades]
MNAVAAPMLSILQELRAMVPCEEYDPAGFSDLYVIIPRRRKLFAGAEHSDAHARYRQIIKISHPDKNVAQGESWQSACEEYFKVLNKKKELPK